MDQSRIDQLFQEGQEYLLFSVKSLLYHRHPEYFEYLDVNDDELFAEPLLFGLLSHPNAYKIPLEQVIYGYLDANERVDAVSVYADERGFVFVPKIGYFITEHRSTRLVMHQLDQGYILKTQEGAEVKAEFFEPIYLNTAPSIELGQMTNPIYDRYFRTFARTQQFANGNHLVDFEGKISRHQQSLEEAMQILKLHCTNEYEKYVASTQRIVLFENPAVRCFVIRETHGMVYLSLLERANATFFLEELIHECSHNVFNAITAKVGDFLKIDPLTPLKQFTDKPYETRNVYGAFHGMYTTYKIVECLLDIWEKNVIPEAIKYELLGRLAINKVRHRTGMQFLPLDEVFTPLGKSLYLYLDERLENALNDHLEFFEPFDFTTHPVLFNYDKFLSDNPIEKWSATI